MGTNDTPKAVAAKAPKESWFSLGSGGFTLVVRSGGFEVRSHRQTAGVALRLFANLLLSSRARFAFFS
jgi:hypothetical protein